jgi:hypothetical protein
LFFSVPFLSVLMCNAAITSGTSSQVIIASSTPHQRSYAPAETLLFQRFLMFIASLSW